MSIIDSIRRNCVQDITYWGNPQNDGFGKYSYDAPVALKGRWENSNERVLTNEGNEEVAKAVVFLLQAVDHGGYLYLGTSTETDPTSVDGALRIIADTEIPRLGSSTEALHKAHCNMSRNSSI